MKRLFYFCVMVLLHINAVSQPPEKPDFWLSPHPDMNALVLQAGLPEAGVVLQQNGNAGSLYKDRINFNPAVVFPGNGFYYYLALDSLHSCDHLSLIVAYHNKEATDSTFGIWEFKRDTLSLLGLSSKYLHAGDSKIRYADSNFRCPVVNSASRQITEKRDSLLFCDTLFLGKNKASGFTGSLAEALVFKKPLSPQDKDRWQSYLSLKYGSTIIKGIYTSGVSDTLWDTCADSLYSFGVAGIGYDTLTGLNQKQSSIYEDVVTISSGEEYAVNEINPHTLPQGNYLIWGHNGEPAEFDMHAELRDSVSYALMQRRWKLRYYRQYTSADIPVVLSCPYPSGFDPQKLCLVVDKSGNENIAFHSSDIYYPDSIRAHKVYFRHPFPTGADMHELKFTLAYASPSDIKGKSALSKNTSFEDSLEETQSSCEITLYPNPSAGKYNLNIKLLEESPVKIKVIDAQGKLMEQSSYSGKRNYSIKGEIALKGSYIISVEYNEGARNIKLVIN